MKPAAADQVRELDEDMAGRYSPARSARPLYVSRSPAQAAAKSRTQIASLPLGRAKTQGPLVQRITSLAES